MKPYTIKNFCSQKMLIVNDINAVDIKALYIQAEKAKIPFAIKTATGVQIWGLFVVAEYLGIADCSKLLKECAN